MTQRKMSTEQGKKQRRQFTTEYKAEVVGPSVTLGGDGRAARPLGYPRRGWARLPSEGMGGRGWGGGDGVGVGDGGRAATLGGDGHPRRGWARGWAGRGWAGIASHTRARGLILAVPAKGSFLVERPVGADLLRRSSDAAEPRRWQTASPASLFVQGNGGPRRYSSRRRIDPA